jgi:hypothetical protein
MRGGGISGYCEYHIQSKFDPTTILNLACTGVLEQTKDLKLRRRHVPSVTKSCRDGDHSSSSRGQLAKEDRFKD